jgi:hypothetical protein
VIGARRAPRWRSRCCTDYGLSPGECCGPCVGPGRAAAFQPAPELSRMPPGALIRGPHRDHGIRCRADRGHDPRYRVA